MSSFVLFGTAINDLFLANLFQKIWKGDMITNLCGDKIDHCRTDVYIPNVESLTLILTLYIDCLTLILA